MNTSTSRNSSYNREYYKKRKEQLKDHKLRKYQSNEDNYKNKAVVRARLNYMEAKLRKSVVGEFFEINGKKEPVYSIIYVTTKLNRSLQTLRAWEKDGTLPEAVMRDSYGNPCYTSSQVLYLTLLLGKIDTGESLTVEQMTEVLKGVWFKPFSTEELERGVYIVKKNQS